MKSIDATTAFDYSPSDMKKPTSSEIAEAFDAVVKGTCYHADALKTKHTIEPARAILTFIPHMSDIPLLIGKSGRVSKAYRYLAKAMSEANGILVDIAFQESYEGRQERYSPAVIDPHFDIRKFEEVFEPLCLCLYGSVPRYEARPGREGQTKIRMEVDETENPIVFALGDVMYPWGLRNGQRISVRSQWTAIAAART